MDEPDTPPNSSSSSSSSSRANTPAAEEVTGTPRRFSYSEVQAAAEQLAPVADLITPHLTDGGPGPKRRVSVLALMVGLHLACIASGGAAVHLAAATRILGWRIPATARTLIGVTGVPAAETAAAFEALEGCLRRRFHQIEKLMSGSGDALLRPRPLRTGRASFPAPRLKQAPRAFAVMQMPRSSCAFWLGGHVGRRRVPGVCAVRPARHVARGE